MQSRNLSPHKPNVTQSVKQEAATFKDSSEMKLNKRI